MKTLITIFLLCATLVQAQTVNQWEMRKRGATGMTSYGITAEDGKAIGFTSGVPAMITVGGTLTINSSAVSGAAAGDILTSDGSLLQKITPGTGVATSLAAGTSLGTNGETDSTKLVIYGLVGDIQAGGTTTGDNGFRGLTSTGYAVFGNASGTGVAVNGVAGATGNAGVFQNTAAAGSSLQAGGYTDIFNFNVLGDGTTILGGATTATELRFLEATGDGSFYTGFKAPNLTADTIYTLPTAKATVAGMALTDAAANGTLSWASFATLGANTFTGAQTLPAGEVGTPSLTTTGDTNTGVYFSAADTVDIATGGVNRASFGATALTLSSGGNLTAQAASGSNAIFGNQNDAAGGYTQIRGNTGGIYFTHTSYGNSMQLTSAGLIFSSNVNITLGGPTIVVHQAISGTGAITAVNTTTTSTTIATTGAATSTLGDGTDGQIKILTMITDAGDCVVTVTNLQGGTTLTFSDVGDVVMLIYAGGKWMIISNNGATLA